MKLSRTLITSTIIAALGGLLFGFDTAVISGTTGALRQVFGLTAEWMNLPGSFWLGFTVASALIGTVFGAALIGRPADALGRRTTLVWMAVLYFVSAVGSAVAWSWTSFLVFRFIGGLAVGGASVVSPMYIAEISPAPWRGRLVAVQQFNIVVGILLAFFSNYLISTLGLGDTAWRWMFGVEAVPAAAFFFLLFLTPRSPRWLVAQDRSDEARGVIARMGTDEGSVDEELRVIQESLALERHSLAEPLFQKAYIVPVVFAILLAMFNQLSGINALMYYGPTIFGMAGAGQNSALLQAVMIGVTNLVFTIIGMSLIDHFGRKKLMIVGSIGYIASLATTAWAFYAYATEFHASLSAMKALAEARVGGAGEAALQTLQTAVDTATAAASQGGTIVLVSMMVFIASHAIGQGSVIWVFLSEIFPNRVRARGVALGCFTHWIMNVIISCTFPVIAEQSGGHAFAFYASMMVLQLIWVLVWMPETKGVPLEEIQKRLHIE